MYVAVVSLLLSVPMRPRVAMIGELTLQGLVLPVGGVKEKMLAEARAGVKTVILPEKNRGALEEMDEEIREKLEFEFVANVD